MLSYALTAIRCDLRDPGWGHDPGFPQRVLLLPHLQRAIFGVCFAFVFQMTRADNSTQDALLIRQEHHCPTDVGLGVVFFLFLFVCCVVACSGFLLVLCGLRHLDSYMDYVKVHTRSFAAIQSDGFACFSQLTSGVYKLVERPGESHECVGRKKKTRLPLPGPELDPSSLVGI